MTVAGYGGQWFVSIYKTPSGEYIAVPLDSTEKVIQDRRGREEISYKRIALFENVDAGFWDLAAAFVEGLEPHSRERIELSDILPEVKTT